MQIHLLLLANAIAVFAALLLIGIVTLRRRCNLTKALREASVISQAAAIPALRSATREIDKEIMRARRSGRPLAVAVLTMDTEPLLDHIRRLTAGHGAANTAAHRQAMQIVQIVFLLIGAILRDAIREHDIVTYDVITDKYLLVMPDCNKAEAAFAMGRMRELLYSRTMVNFIAGLAEFPDDGLTLDDLLSVARGGETVQSDTSKTENSPVSEAA